MSDTSSIAKRITVGLVAPAAASLDRLQARTGLQITDVINRAVSVYDFVDEATSKGQELIVRDPSTGSEQLIRIL